MHKLNITNEDINIDIEDTDEYIKYIEKLTNIQWRIIPDFEDYIISEYGDIISLRSKKILKFYLDKDNYYQIALYKNNIYKTFRINRLVYSVFINDKDIEDFDVHHKDENKLNNHYSNLEKMTKSAHNKYHHNLEFEKNIEKYKKYYKDKIKYNLSNSKLAKLYNISESAISQGIKRYITYIRLNKDKNRYNNLSKEEKKDFFKEISIEEKKDRAKRYLKECKKIYNLRYKDHISTKKIANRLNLQKSTIELRISNYKMFLYLNKDLDKYISLSKKDKNKLYNKIYNNKLLKDQRKYLEKCKKIYNLRYKNHLSTEKIANRLNLSLSTIEKMIKRYKIYLYLDKDFDKYISLSRKDKDKLYSKLYNNKLSNNQRRYLERCKKLYDLKYKDHLSNKEIIKKCNISLSNEVINEMIKQYRIYLYLDKDLDKYISLFTKDKNKLYSDIILVNDQRKYLNECKKIYNDKYENGLSTKEIAKKYNILYYIIEKMIKRYKIYLYLDKDFDKYISLSEKEKNDIYNNIILVNDQRRYLEKCKKLYDLKYKDHLSNKEIIKKCNISLSNEVINEMIKQYRIYLYLNKDFDKYISLSRKDKDKLYSDTILVNDQRKYLNECKELYDLKYKDHLSTKEIAKKYNVPEYIIYKRIKNYEIYLYLNKDFDKYISLSDKDKDKLYNKILVERRDNVILDIGKKIKDLKLFGLSTKDIVNKLNISVNQVKYYYKRYKDLIRKI